MLLTADALSGKEGGNPKPRRYRLTGPIAKDGAQARTLLGVLRPFLRQLGIRSEVRIDRRGPLWREPAIDPSVQVALVNRLDRPSHLTLLNAALRRGLFS
jgi:hypothetical protein